MPSDSSRTKIYNDRRYLHTTMVRHQGTTVAFAMDDTRRIFYSVLDPDRAQDAPDGQEHAAEAGLDVAYWPEEPAELSFPREIARAGYGVTGALALPRVKAGSRTEAGAAEVLGADEVDGFLSSTARLTADVPFQAVSDGKHVHVFRQSVGDGHEDALFHLTGGGCSGGAARDDTVRAPATGSAVPVVRDALLCDRFLLVGGRLRPAPEVRYRRSRHRTLPDSAKDSLGTRDMDGNDFHEPTLELGFAGRINGGRFTALLLPTAVHDVRRWQFFVHNDRTGRIDALNVEQGADGLFDTEGTRFYTSPDPVYRKAVLERGPGLCPFTGAGLVPVATTEGFAETALEFDGTGAYLSVPATTPPPGSGPYTLEMWLSPAATGGTVVAGGIVLRIDDEGFLRLGHAGGGTEAVSSVPVPVEGSYTHIAVVHDGTTAVLYVDGSRGDGAELPPVGPGGDRLLIGARAGEDGVVGSFFTGVIDEIRIWDRARGADELERDRSYRLIGDESGLTAYYRFDAGSGTELYDQTDSAAHGTLHGGPRWITSGAPIGDHPGVRRESFSVPGRTVGSGLAAVLYHQQERAVTGHSAEPRPLKKHARVLLTWVAAPDGGGDGGPGCVAALDLAVARDGRLVQLPDAVELPLLGEAVEAVDPKEITVVEEAVDTLKRRLQSAVDARAAAEADAARLPALQQELTAQQQKTAQLTDDHTYLDTRMRLLKFPAGVAASGTTTAESVYLAVTKDTAGTPGISFTDDPEDERALWIVNVSRSGKHLSYVNLRTKLRLHYTARGTTALRWSNLRTWSYDDEWFTPTFVADFNYWLRPYGIAKQIVLVGDGRCYLASDRGDAAWTPYGSVEGKPHTGTPLVSVPVHAPTGLEKPLADARDAVTALEERVRQAERVRDERGVFDVAITGLEGELEARQAELGRLTGGLRGRSALSLPMPQLGRDRLGLGWSGALLTFARATAAPSLLESGSGHVGLYFRDEEGYFTAAYYDTGVARSAKRLPAGTGSGILLTARDPGTDLKDVTVEVTESGHPGRCTVTLRDGGAASGGERETWPLMPRRADLIVRTLNGARDEPALLGEVAELWDDLLTLEEPAGRALPAGALLSLGGRVRVLEREAAGDATELMLSADEDDIWVAPGTPVHLVSYDPSLVRHTRPGATARHGSRLVTAALAGPVAEVPDGTAADLADARPTRWWGDIPGRALSFTEVSRPPSLPGERHGAVRAADDLTLEAWVQPGPGGFARLVHAQVPGSRYTLALGAAAPDGGRPLVAGVGDRFVTSRATVPDGRWTHVAAAFEQSWALSFDGDASLEAPHTEALNLSRDLTLEVFFRTPALGAPQGLVSKGRIADGRGRHVPYQLLLDAEGRLVLAMETADGAVVRHTSTEAVTPGVFHRVAVVRKAGQSLQEQRGTKDITVTDSSGTPATHKVDVVESVLTEEWFDIRFSIDGRDAGTVRHRGAAPLGGEGALEIGRAWQGAEAQPFTGLISEVRIWNTAREMSQLGAEPTTRVQGLAARWRFEENEGNTAHDDTGSHPARLRGVVWEKNPDPRGSVFRLYVDGQPTPSAPPAAGAPSGAETTYGDEQFTLAGRWAGEEVHEGYTGTLEEVRVWRTARSEEQILDNLFTRLRGEKEDLLAYYPFDDDSTEDAAGTLADRGLRGCDLVLSGPEARRPSPVLSTAPISGDTVEVRPVFSKVTTGYARAVSGTPAVTEYADIQRDGGRGTRGVLKRCYGFLRDGSWRLVTGYKIGDLLTEWVGQVQFDPQIIGFVEGAPPVPSENLVPTKNPRNFTYLNASSVTFAQADQVVSTLSSARERSVDAAFGFSLAKEVDVSTLLITAPLGMGTAKPIAEGGVSLSGGGRLEYSNAWGDETTVSQGRNTTRATSVGLSGGWEDPEHLGNTFNGRRFLPANTGYALVQSETADLFALRLAHNQALVAYRILPNPDIPRDWNILPFPINPLYTKQGTLDGTIGFDENGRPVPDPHYDGAPTNGEHSYHKPREAYALKRRITEEQQRLRAYYDTVSTETHAEDPTAGRARKLLGDFVGPLREPESKAPEDTETARGFARRNIANTYVWSADGGFFAETTEATDVVTEVTSGSYDLTGSTSFSASGGVKIFGVGAALQVDGSVGGALHRTRARAREATRTFGLEVVCDPAGDMQRYDSANTPVFDENGNPVEVPGRVDAYRFMTFYLDADKENFEDFYGKVVDPLWLSGSDHPNAAALRQAQQSDKKPPCWRVFHRVTFVSRKLPAVVPEGASPVEKAMRAENVSSDYELIRKLEPYVKEHATTNQEFAAAVRDAVATRFPRLVPYTEQIITYLARYYELKP